jgi:uncharacterized protein YkwD
MTGRFRNHWIRVTLAGALCAAASLSAPSEASAQTEALATRMVRLVNDLRVARGLNLLQVDPVLQQTSNRWSAVMAGSRSIFHNDNLRDDLEDNWSKVGENVGRGPAIDDIEVGFSTSPEHLKNLLDPRGDVMAIGVVAGADGFLYVTQHFEDLRDYRPQPVAAAATSPRVIRRVRPVRR